MTLSCIIVTKDRPDDLQRCLQSLQLQSHPAEQVIVVDGGQSVGTLVQSFGYQYVSAPAGITRQRNVGRSLVLPGTDCVVYCDDDTELPPDAFQKVRANFLAHPNIVGLTGSVDQQMHYSILKKVFGWLTLTYTAQPFGITAGIFNIINPMAHAGAVAWLPGAFMAYRWSAVQTLEFDEWFAEYGLGEDLDFSYRAATHGALWVDPAIVIQHHHSNVNRNWRRFGSMRIVNRAYLRKKFWPKSFSKWLGMWWANLWLWLGNGLRGLISKRYAQEWIGESQGILRAIAHKEDK